MHVDEWPTGRVVLPTFGNKSRKTTKSDPSTGDQFWESRKTAKIDAPVGLLGLVSRTGRNYDSVEETKWPCASFGQLSENRGKRLSPIRLRGISSANREFLFKPVSTKCRAVPCRAVPCRAVPCRAVPCRAVPCRAVPCRAVPCRAVPCRAVPCRAVPCRAVPCRAVPCRAVPCRAVPCRADRWVNGGSNKEPLI